MWWTWDSLVRIFTPSSRVVSPAGTLGNTMLLPLSLGYSSTTGVLDQSIGLVYTHVP